MSVTPPRSPCRLQHSSWLLPVLLGSAGLLLVLLFPAPAPAHAADATVWLARAAKAARSENYSGVYMYAGGDFAETARVTRRHRGKDVSERTESLDGSRREVVRRGDEIRYIFFDTKTVRVDRRVSGRSFPEMLPEDTAGLIAHYDAEDRGTSRVAGRPVQVILLRAKDEFRFTHEIWADQETGLPLKIRVMDEHGGVVEQFAFTEIAIGTRLDPGTALPGRRAAYSGWRIENATVRDSPPKASVPTVAAIPAPSLLPPGFRKVAQVWRMLPGHRQPVAHTVYSDGLATLSIFVDPDAARVAGHEGYSQRGALGVIARALGGHAVITVGELPPVALRKVADSVTVVPQP